MCVDCNQLLERMGLMVETHDKHRHIYVGGVANVYRIRMVSVLMYICLYVDMYTCMHVPIYMCILLFGSSLGPHAVVSAQGLSDMGGVRTRRDNITSRKSELKRKHDVPCGDP